MNGLEQFPRDELGRLILPDTTLERFWWYVDRRGEDECWEWMGFRHPQNYGAFTVVRGYSTKTHRLSFEIANGIIPPGMMIRHLCHNRPCVNPAHLVVGTNAENMADRVSSGRSRFYGLLDDTMRPEDYVSRGPKPRTTDERFWSKVLKTKECWLWTGATKGAGPQAAYGHFHIQGRGLVPAHRYAYETLVGAIPEAMSVCHNCPSGDNPACVRPDHLFLGTQSDNMRDMIRKGRGNRATGERHSSRTHPERVPCGERHGSRTHPELVPRGSGHARAKLTEIDIPIITDRYAMGTSIRQLAEDYQVTGVNIHHVLFGGGWRHVKVDRSDAFAIRAQRQEHPRPSAKLTALQVQHIRAWHKQGAIMMRMAKHFAVSPATVEFVIHRRTWAEVPDMQIKDAPPVPDGMIRL